MAGSGSRRPASAATSARRNWARPSGLRSASLPATRAKAAAARGAVGRPLTHPEGDGGQAAGTEACNRETYPEKRTASQSTPENRGTARGRSVHGAQAARCTTHGSSSGKQSTRCQLALHYSTTLEAGGGPYSVMHQESSRHEESGEDVGLTAVII